MPKLRKMRQFLQFRNAFWGISAKTIAQRAANAVQAAMFNGGFCVGIVGLVAIKTPV